MMIATEIRPLAHIYEIIPFLERIWVEHFDFNALTRPLIYMFNLEGHERIFL